MAGQITTAQLTLYRQDWAEADTVSGEVGDMTLWNLFGEVPADDKVIYLKPNTGLGYATLTEEGSPAPERLPLPGSQLTLTQKRRAVKYSHTIEMQLFDRYGKVAEMGRDAVAAVKKRMVKDAADFWLNNAFTDTIATGSALYADAHAIGNITLDNLGTAAALSPSAVGAGLTALRSQRDGQNTPLAYGGDVLLIVPPALEFTAATIAQSQLMPGTADNDKNVYASRLRVVVEPEATGSNTAYAIVAADSSKLYAKKAVKVAMGNNMDADEDGNVKMVKYAVYAYGATLPFNTWGNAGA